MTHVYYEKFCNAELKIIRQALQAEKENQEGYELRKVLIYYLDLEQEKRCIQEEDRY